MSLVQELLQLCIDKNETTKHDLFFEFAGHVKCLSVFYYKNGHINSKKLTYILSLVKINNEEALKKAINELQELV